MRKTITFIAALLLTITTLSALIDGKRRWWDRKGRAVDFAASSSDLSS